MCFKKKKKKPPQRRFQNAESDRGVRVASESCELRVAVCMSMSMNR